MISETQNNASRTDSSGTAYLVVREGSRWTDVYQLVPGRRVTIGRGSTNQIVVRSDQCSRHHAELFQQTGRWTIRDLGSRNGTAVDSERIEHDHALQPGETINVAGCQLVFVHDVRTILGGRDGGTHAGASRAEDQQTAEIDANLITHRSVRPRLLDPAVQSDPAAVAALYRITHTIARAENIADAARLALDAVLEQASLTSGAVWISDSAVAGHDQKNAPAGAAADDLRTICSHSRPGRGYHAAPQILVDTVMLQGEAVLARNIQDDHQLAAPDSQGEISTTGTLLVPIRSAQRTLGFIHAYSARGEAAPTPELLEFALSIADHLGPAVDHLSQHQTLSRHLDRSRRRVHQLREQLHSTTRIVGNSAGIQQVRDAVRRAGPTGATILIRGESGVGKELVAAAVHAASPRRDGPFVCLNCAALSPTLLESELFGHEKGAFTGATERKLGKFEAADGGTLMLDEIGEMSPEVQAKFLRVLEGQKFERVGGNEPIHADVRVIAATNRDLEQAVREKKFRSDLYFRLHVIELVVPPLRNRGDDVLLIADYFLKRFSEEVGRRVEGFTEAALARLKQYNWPGNIRELKNVIERAVVLGKSARIEADELVLSSLQPTGSDASAAVGEYQPKTLADLEREHVLATLRHTGGHKSNAAAILGVERSTLDRKLKRFGLRAKDWL